MAQQPRSQSELALARLVDAELVRLALDGSASALRLIVRRHNQRLYRVARAIVRDDAEAEDVLQEAYLSALANLAKFRADASLSTWLTRIVVNQALVHRRPENVLVGLDALDKFERPDAELAMPHPTAEEDPERSATRAQVHDLLERAIDELPEPFRLVFVMRMVEQLSVQETASVLRIREATVKTRLYRAKKLLREQLQMKLGSALTDIFPFQDPRCANFTDALLAQLAERGEPAGRSRVPLGEALTVNNERRKQ
jgi:RNA polymerase sigma-70 factor (ECF subfamily)